ncbi:hypothetical protein [Clostridium oryzae]|uniref:Uncharacterized protein n=1 Tax=Clostridium oryzae TaxID=1450648 RepID=A0A1V4ITN1_9CLOT|nr:hypothetical protein [Clostridium oryzae]OPJ63259.1 hypothetical protein CLORY_13420 [Clostridium oryzae]
MAAFLLVVGLLLICINTWLIRKEQRSFKTVYNDRQANINETNELITTLRKEMAETILELQTEIYDIKSRLDKSDENNGNSLKNFDEQDEYSIEQDNIEDDMKSSEDGTANAENIDNEDTQLSSGNSFKVAEIEKLLKEGYTEEQVCEKLSLGKGEVLLIRDLYIK